jgi:hypothetical protein
MNSSGATTSARATATRAPIARQMRTGHLQRQCSCGMHAVAGGDCERCSNQQGSLQRKLVDNEGRAGEAPPVVHEVLSSPGQPLDRAARALLEPRFGHDFSDVRVHTDAKAADSARAMHASAYAVGRDLVFGSGQYAPATAHGARLLAHELTHVVQHSNVGGGPLYRKAISQPFDAAETEADATAERVLQGERVQVQQAPSAPVQGQLSPGAVAGVVAGGAGLVGLGIGIAARAVVKRWAAGDIELVVTPSLKILLIREMQSGPTGDDDERAILALLRGSTHAELEVIFGAQGIDPKELDSDFQGDEENELRGFYDRQFEGGHRAVLRGEKKLKPELMLQIRGGYSWPQLQVMLGQRITRIETTLRGVPEDKREAVGHEMVSDDAQAIYQQLQGISNEERERAAQDMGEERVRRDVLLSDVEFAMLDKATPELKWKRLVLNSAVVLIDLILERLYRDIAMTAPDQKQFGKQTTALTPAQERAARTAIEPVKRVAGTFVEQLPGETQTYTRKVEVRTPGLVDDAYKEHVGSRTEKEHDDPAKVHKLTELATIGKKSQSETDRVFGTFKKGPAFEADELSSTGTVSKRGTIHDVWQGAQEKLQKDPSYERQWARFWMFYLIQNDDQIKSINYKHNAVPKLDENDDPLNDAGIAVRAAGDKYLSDDAHARRLFEIGRAWPGFQGKGQVSVQIFKRPTAREDRRFLWKSLYILIHEYLHTLKEKKYEDYAHSVGGESTAEGSTLIEGVDTLLAETVWTSAKPRTSMPEIREAVEPEALKAGEPFDASLLPQVPPEGRYDVYRNALRLVAVVGIRNLYGAYFYGDIKLIGGTLPDATSKKKK